MLRKITFFMIELVFILFLGMLAIGIIAGTIQGLMVGGVVFTTVFVMGLYTAALTYAMANIGTIIAGTFLTFGGYITYRVLTDED